MIKKAGFYAFFMCLCIMFCSHAHAQFGKSTVKVDDHGNFVAIKDTSTKVTGEPTGKTFTDEKGASYPVYKSATGKYFIKKVSKKSGREYKRYLKVDA